MEVVFEDDCLLAINKPNNLIVHQSKFAGSIDEFSLIQLLNKERTNPIYPIHRLDRKTSGIILFAKNEEIILSVQKQFNTKTLEKTYWAIVRGHVLEKGKIDTPIKPEDKTEYKEALTIYKPLSSITVDIPVKPYDQSRYTLLELKPKTGRTHQLRKHCNKIAHPIIGDPKYGNRHHNHMFIERFGTDKLFLHAKSLKLQHPISGDEIILEAELPQFWLETFRLLKWK